MTGCGKSHLCKFLLHDTSMGVNATTILYVTYKAELPETTQERDHLFMEMEMRNIGLNGKYDVTKARWPNLRCSQLKAHAFKKIALTDITPKVGRLFNHTVVVFDDTDPGLQDSITHDH